VKIALFHNLPSGGAKRSLYEWVKRLSVDNEIHLYGYSESSEKYLNIRPYCTTVKYFWKNNILSTGYNVFLKLWVFLKILYLSKLIANEIDSIKYDAVFVHHDTYVQSPLLLIFLKTKSTYYCQEPFRRAYGDRVLRKDNLLYLMQDLLLVVTDQLLKKLDKKAIRSSNNVLANSMYSTVKIYDAYCVNASVVYLGVDTEQFKYMSDVKKENFVLSVGRLDPSKGHDTAINALSYLEREIRPKLKIMSDSENLEYKKYLEELAARKNVDLLIQTVPEDELSLTYNKSMLLLSMQRNEPLGLVALEAMACGVPVVGVSEGGITETVTDNETGFLCPRDEEYISRKIRELIVDEAKRKEFSLQCIIHANEKWSWDVSTSKIQNALIN